MGVQATALGQDASVFGVQATALGQDALAQFNNTTAVGAGAQATVANATALGDGAVASGANSVALGAGSVASAPNTVSVGAPGAERRITNVAPGQDPTDAVNMSQLGVVENQVNQNTQNIQANAQNIAANQHSIAVNRRAIAENRALIEANTAAIANLDRKLETTREKAYSGVAAAATLDMLVPPSGPGKTTIMAGVAFYEGESAVGVNMTHHVGGRRIEEKRVYINAGVSVTSGNTVLSRAMAGMEF